MLFAYNLCVDTGDGQITPQELAAVMRALGEEITEKDIMVMIQEADKDGDGNIDFEGMLFFLCVCISYF